MRFEVVTLLQGHGEADVVWRDHCRHLLSTYRLGHAQPQILDDPQALDYLLSAGEILAVKVNGNLGGYAILADYHNAWTSRSEAFALAAGLLEVAGCDKGATLSVLLDGVEEWARLRSHSLMRLRLLDSSWSSAWEQALYLAKWQPSALVPTIQTVGERTPINQEDNRQAYQVRAATANDHSFVIDLMIEAVWAALSEFERSAITRNELAKSVNAEFLQCFRSGECTSYISEVQNRSCGHGTVQDLGRHPLLGHTEAELLDIFLLPCCQNQGLGQSLTSRIMAHCREHDIRWLHGTIATEGIPAGRLASLLAMLREDGWFLSERIYYKGLPQ